MTRTDDTDGVSTLHDPETLDGRSEVVLTEETTELPPSHFDHWRTKAGLVGIGVTAETGELMLWDGPHGWTLPYVKVDPGEDFAGVARDAVDELIGVMPTLAGVERATRITYHIPSGQESLTRHEIVFRTAPVDADAADAGPTIRWASSFDESDIVADDPDDIGDEATDVRLFLE